MRLHQSITAERVIDLAREDDDRGICNACGEDAEGVEPDARGYRCTSCGAMEVYGIGEILLEVP